MKKHGNFAKVMKGNEKDLQKRIEAANEEIKKTLGKYNLGLFAVPQLAQVQGSASFVIQTVIHLVEVKEQEAAKVETPKLAEA